MMFFRKPEQPKLAELPYTFLTKRRPCLVDGDQAFFHAWVGQDAVITEDDGANRVARRTYALVEYIDGTVEHVFPERVRFTDH